MELGAQITAQLQEPSLLTVPWPVVNPEEEEEASVAAGADMTEVAAAAMDTTVLPAAGAVATIPAVDPVPFC